MQNKWKSMYAEIMILNNHNVIPNVINKITIFMCMLFKTIYADRPLPTISKEHG